MGRALGIRHLILIIAISFGGVFAQAQTINITQDANGATIFWDLQGYQPLVDHNDIHVTFFGPISLFRLPVFTAYQFSNAELSTYQGQWFQLYPKDLDNGLVLPQAFLQIQIPPPLPQVRPVRGVFESLSGSPGQSYVASGWACLETNYSPVQVVLKLDGTMNATTPRQYYMDANLPTSDAIDATCQTSGSRRHGFSIAIDPDFVALNLGKSVDFVVFSPDQGEYVRLSGAFSLPSAIPAIGVIRNPFAANPSYKDTNFFDQYARPKITGWACIPGQASTIPLELHIGPSMGNLMNFSPGGISGIAGFQDYGGVTATLNLDSPNLQGECLTGFRRYGYEFVLTPELLDLANFSQGNKIWVYSTSGVPTYLPDSGTYFVPKSIPLIGGLATGDSKGFKTDARGNTAIIGWACYKKPLEYNKPVKVKIYANNRKENGGVYLGTTTANLPGADARSATLCGRAGNFAFEFPLTIQARNTYAGQGLYVYIVDPMNRADTLIKGEVNWVGGVMNNSSPWPTFPGTRAVPSIASFLNEGANGRGPLPERPNWFRLPAGVTY